MGQLFVSAEPSKNSTHNAIVRWHGPNGEEVANSKALIDNHGNITQPGGATIQGKDVSRVLLSTDDPLVIPAGQVNFTKSSICQLLFSAITSQIKAAGAGGFEIWNSSGNMLIWGSTTLRLQTQLDGDIECLKSDGTSNRMTVKGKFRVQEAATGEVFIEFDNNKLDLTLPLFFLDPSDTSKRMTFSLGGATTGKTTTFVFLSTASRSITFPDATDTLVGRATTDTLTNKTLTSPTLTTPTVASFVNASHDHSNAAGGGTLATSTYRQESHIALISQTTALVF